ncbi:hypothetical protein [Xenophilus sp. Marseille-Q4582]|uniref:hypothetical protein n=1 Tax=Xenophilus sp. Marseille-Q4582 TaxID=2866600 RepID=UPI001CE3B754|nr:hypothetical protein [Xenophilus sp. Marseille-Q4582]
MSVGNEPLGAYVALIARARRLRRLPWAWKARLGMREGRARSFLLSREAAIVAAMQARLGVDAQSAQVHFRQLCESTGVAAQMVWHLPFMDDAWLGLRVRLEDESPMADLAWRGGLVVSHHSYHQNLLPVALRRWGIGAHPVANSPAVFSSTAFGAHGFLQEFTHYLDRATVAQLGRGAQALYIDRKRAFPREVRQVWTRREVVFMCADFNDALPTQSPHAFLSGTLAPPTGLMRMALAAGVPVFFAGLAWDGQARCYRMALQPLRLDGLDTLVQAYVAALDAWIRRAPWSWQGWESMAGAGA